MTEGTALSSRTQAPPEIPTPTGVRDFISHRGAGTRDLRLQFLASVGAPV